MGGRLNLDGKTLNLGGGTLTLYGGTGPPYNLSTGLQYDCFWLQILDPFWAKNIIKPGLTLIQ